MGDSDLTTLDAAVDWIGSSADSLTLQRLITASSAAIQSWIGYRVRQASYSRVFNGRGGQRLYLPDVPVTAVSSLCIGVLTIPAGVAPSPSAPGSAGYFLGSSQSAAWIDLSGAYGFWRGVGNIAVSYTAGYESVPSDIEQACLDMVRIAYERKTTRAANLAEMTAGPIKMIYEDAVRNAVEMPVPPSIRMNLQPYKRVAGP